jgi:hypothetical protein
VPRLWGGLRASAFCIRSNAGALFLRIPKCEVAGHGQPQSRYAFDLVPTLPANYEAGSDDSKARSGPRIAHFLVPLLWRGRNNGNGASDIALADVKAVNSSRASGDDASLIEKIGIGGRELKADGATIFDHACRLGFEGRLEAPGTPVPIGAEQVVAEDQEPDGARHAAVPGRRAVSGAPQTRP